MAKETKIRILNSQHLRYSDTGIVGSNPVLCMEQWARFLKCKILNRTISQLLEAVVTFKIPKELAIFYPAPWLRNIKFINLDI